MPPLGPAPTPPADPAQPGGFAAPTNAPTAAHVAVSGRLRRASRWTLTLAARAVLAASPVMLVALLLAMAAGGASTVRVAAVGAATVGCVAAGLVLLRPPAHTVRAATAALEVAADLESATPDPPATLSMVYADRAGRDARQLAEATARASAQLTALRDVHIRATTNAARADAAAHVAAQIDDQCVAMRETIDVLVAHQLDDDTAVGVLELDHQVARAAHRARHLRVASGVHDDCDPGGDGTTADDAVPLDDIVRVAAGGAVDYRRIDIGPVLAVAIAPSFVPWLTALLTEVLDAAFADAEVDERIYIGTDGDIEPVDGSGGTPGDAASDPHPDVPWSILVAGGRVGSGRDVEAGGRDAFSLCSSGPDPMGAEIEIEADGDTRLVVLTLRELTVTSIADEAADVDRILARSRARAGNGVRPHMMVGGRTAPGQRVARSDRLGVSTRCEPLEHFRWEAAALLAAAQDPAPLAALVERTGIPLFAAEIIAADLAATGSLVIRRPKSAPVRSSRLQAALSG